MSLFWRKKIRFMSEIWYGEFTFKKCVTAATFFQLRHVHKDENQSILGVKKNAVLNQNLNMSQLNESARSN